MFRAIIDRQEREDDEVCRSERQIIAAVEQEFANAEEIIAAARACKVTGRKFFSGECTIDSLPVTPVRKCSGFHMHKHTSSQVPYLHSHDFYELIYVHSGRCIQRTGKGEKLTLSEGQMCIIAPGAVHKLERCGAGDIIFKMDVPSNLYAEVMQGFPEGGNKPVSVYKNTGGRVQFIVYRLLEETAHADQFTPYAVKGCLLMLFSELFRGQKSCSSEAEVLYSYLSAHLKDADLASFARHANYSYGYAGRFVREKTGKSFTDNLGIFRVKRAAKLLAETDMTVDEVALSVGYVTPSGFYKQFCAAYGMTPAEYRRTFC